MAIAELSDEDLVAFLYEDQGGSALDVINDVNEIFSPAQNDHPIPNDAPASLNELIESVAQEVGAHVEEVFGSTSTGSPLSVVSGTDSSNDEVQLPKANGNGKQQCGVCGGEAARFGIA